MDTLLKNFYKDKHTREAVHAFLLDMLNQEAVERVLSRKEVSGLADAKEVITKAFSTLKDTYEPKPEKKVQSSR